MKGVQCYELFGGIALKIHTFSFFIFNVKKPCRLHNGLASLTTQTTRASVHDLFHFKVSYGAHKDCNWLFHLMSSLSVLYVMLSPCWAE